MDHPFCSEFDVDRSSTFLNSGSLSITPRVVFEAAEKYRRDYEKNPTFALFDTWGKIWSTQKNLAKFLGARPQDIFIRANVTHAMNDFLLGMPIRGRGEILYSNLEYGAMINVCRMRAEREGHSLRSFNLPLDTPAVTQLSAKDLVARVLSELRPETKLLMLSHVMTGTGLVLPILEIAKETRRRGILLAVDAAHAPGALPIDLSQWDDVDFYAGNLHKWMMAPKGTGFGWLPERHQASLVPLEAGWTTFEIPPQFGAFGEGNAFAARMLMASCHDFSSIFAITDTIAFWERLGPDAIRIRLRELRQYLEDRVKHKLGWPLLSPPEGELRGPLTTFDLPDPLSQLGFEWMHRLWKEHRLQIITPLVDGKYRIRISPHICNTEAEIDRAVEILSTQSS